MGWADDMYEGGYTEEHGGLMDDAPSMSARPKASKGRKSGPGSIWSDHDRNQMVDMFKADVSIKIIAKKLNRTPLAIACQLYNISKISGSIKDKFIEDRSFDTSISTINHDIKNHNKITRKENTKVRKLKMKILGVICIAIAVFGWTGYWFAGSGFAALIALGFLVTGISLISSNKE
jgi:hypothetical protein